jgi:transcriptional regulator with XRE-family HTH domain
MTSGTIQHDELASFLRSRREATDPVAVGLPPGGRRRTPGLRREEVAQLSGVSVTWYTWLEQARQIGVSRQVIDSLARTLRMDPSERAHLFTLAGMAVPAEKPRRQSVDETLGRLVHALQPNPAYVMNPWWDLLAYNDAYAGLVGGLDQRPSSERNILWLNFTDTRIRELFVDWNGQARQLVGQLRGHLAEYPNEPRGTELVEELETASPKFAELWETNTVSRFETSHKRFDHPEAGRLDLDYTKLAAANDDRQHLVVFLPSDPRSAEKLDRLSAGIQPQS